MSENSLSNIIRNWAKPLSLTPNQINQLDDFFKVKISGDYIYPSTLKSKINVDIKLVYILMDAIRKAGYAKVVFELYCSNCHRSKGIYLDSLASYDGSKTCDFCNHSINLLNDSIVLYQMVKTDYSECRECQLC